MDHDDRFGGVRPVLPAEAGRETRSGFEPDDDWLLTAEVALQQEAMQRWFETRYWDPANDTPYNSEEGGYLFIHGGPYAAEDELYGRFGDLLSDEVIRAVVDDIESDGIEEWAPIHTEPDYDSEFEYQGTVRGDSFLLFERRVEDVEALANASVSTELEPLLHNMLYSSLIAALEAYLSDTMSYWVKAEEKVFRKFVSSCEEFKQRKFSLSQIFDRMDTLKDDVEKYLQQLVWHRLDKVVPLMIDSLGATIPDFGPLMKHILVRHDIVHRGGKTKDGAPVVIGHSGVQELRVTVTTFVNAIERSLNGRFPQDLSGLVDEVEF
jgi:hypothetical protein